MEKTLVSVILTCYNQEKYLAEALDSVLNQTYPNWECIILNDGSTDGSEEVAKRYASKDKRFIYVYQNNQGVVAARNNAIKISKGDYILPLDGDDMISSDYIKLATDVLDNNKDVILVSCNVERFGKESGFLPLPDLNIRNILRSGCCVSSSMYRREMYESVGGYKEYMSEGWEDWEFFISLLETGGKVYKLNQILFFYRILQNSRDRKIDTDRNNRLKDHIVRLHPSLYFSEYSKLLYEYETIINSRGYKILSVARKIVDRIRFIH